MVLGLLTPTMSCVADYRKRHFLHIVVVLKEDFLVTFREAHKLRIVSKLSL